MFSKGLYIWGSMFGAKWTLLTGFTTTDAFKAVWITGNWKVKENVITNPTKLWNKAFYPSIDKCSVFLQISTCPFLSIWSSKKQEIPKSVWLLTPKMMPGLYIQLILFFAPSIGLIPVPGPARSDRATFKLQCGRLAGLGGPWKAPRCYGGRPKTKRA